MKLANKYDDIKFFCSIHTDVCYIVDKEFLE